MPKVVPLTTEQRFIYTLDNIAPKLEEILLKKHIQKKQVAEFMGVCPQAISGQFRRGSVTLDTFIAVVHLADIDADQMERLVRFK